MSTIFQTSLEIALSNAEMNQSELASRTGLTPAAISQYLSGDRQPMITALLQICYVLKLTPNDMLGFHSEKHIAIREKVAKLERKLDQIQDILER
jgi:transcriptional regulator with XRE-family HTH domain